MIYTGQGFPKKTKKYLILDNSFRVTPTTRLSLPEPCYYAELHGFLMISKSMTNIFECLAAVFPSNKLMRNILATSMLIGAENVSKHIQGIFEALDVKPIPTIGGIIDYFLPNGASLRRYVSNDKFVFTFSIITLSNLLDLVAKMQSDIEEVLAGFITINGEIHTITRKHRELENNIVDKIFQPDSTSAKKFNVKIGPFTPMNEIIKGITSQNIKCTPKHTVVFGNRGSLTF